MRAQWPCSAHTLGALCWSPIVLNNVECVEIRRHSYGVIAKECRTSVGVVWNLWNSCQMCAALACAEVQCILQAGENNNLVKRGLEPWFWMDIGPAGIARRGGPRESMIYHRAGSRQRKLTKRGLRPCLWTKGDPVGTARRCEPRRATPKPHRCLNCVIVTC